MNTDNKAQTMILIADDSAEVAKRLVELLSDLDRVAVLGPARDGMEALQLFEKYGPHGAVLDLQMPKLNGMEVLGSIRKQNATCLVIILTNHHGERFRDRCIEAGANFFLQKSKEFGRVREIIAALSEDRS